MKGLLGVIASVEILVASGGHAFVVQDAAALGFVAQGNYKHKPALQKRPAVGRPQLEYRPPQTGINGMSMSMTRQASALKASEQLRTAVTSSMSGNTDWGLYTAYHEKPRLESKIDVINFVRELYTKDSMWRKTTLSPSDQDMVLSVLRETDPESGARLLKSLDIGALLNAFLSSLPPLVLGRSGSYFGYGASTSNFNELVAYIGGLKDSLDFRTKSDVIVAVWGISDPLPSCSEGLILDIFTSVTNPTELSVFKKYLSSSLKRHPKKSGMMLMMNSLTPETSSKMLDHIRKHYQYDNPLEQSPMKIISEIDDTIVNNRYDKKYPNGQIYPGVLALMTALDHHDYTDDPFWTEVRAHPSWHEEGDLSFLSSRPKPLLEELERTVALAGVDLNFTSVLPVKPWSLRSKKGILAAKFDNMEAMRRTYPEYRMIFIGSSSSEDAITLANSWREQQVKEEADAAAAGKEFVPWLPLSLIHDARDKDDSTRYSPERRARLEKSSIIVFDTFIDAAIACYHRGLIDFDGLNRVRKSAMDEFDAIEWQLTGTPEEQARQRTHVDSLRDELLTASRTVNMIGMDDQLNGYHSGEFSGTMDDW